MAVHRNLTDANFPNDLDSPFFRKSRQRADHNRIFRKLFDGGFLSGNCQPYFVNDKKPDYQFHSKCYNLSSAGFIRMVYFEWIFEYSLSSMVQRSGWTFQLHNSFWCNSERCCWHKRFNLLYLDNCGCSYVECCCSRIPQGFLTIAPSIFLNYKEYVKFP